MAPYRTKSAIHENVKWDRQAGIDLGEDLSSVGSFSRVLTG